MRFGKLKMFFLLQGLAIFILLCYFSVWMISEKTMGTVVRPYGSTLNVTYTVKSQTFTSTLARYDVPYGETKVPVRYLLFRPSSSRINSFMGLLAEPLAWWFVYLLASAMLLLTNNTVFSRGTIFQLHKKFPWLSMDEYFPEAGHSQFYTRKHSQPQQKEQKKLNNLTRKKD